jgi:hypothetical protein
VMQKSGADKKWKGKGLSRQVRGCLRELAAAAERRAIAREAAAAAATAAAAAGIPGRANASSEGIPGGGDG